MKLNDKALEAAAQVEWENWGYQGRFREQSANPDYWPRGASRVVTAYLDVLDAEGLADLYEYWCERIEALPVPDKIRKGDLVACSVNGGWHMIPAPNSYAAPAPYWRVLRRAHQPRQWKVGDLVDETRDLPPGTAVRDKRGVAEYSNDGVFLVAGSDVEGILSDLDNPRIIWLPENGDES